MSGSLVRLISIAQKHAETESGQDVDAILATMEGEPIYEYYPLCKKFVGMNNTRRYYEHFVHDVQKRVIAFSPLSESVGVSGVVQEYTMTVKHEGDAEPTSHRIMALLTFGEEGLTGERIYTDEKLSRTLIGPLWDEMEPIALDRPEG